MDKLDEIQEATNDEENPNEDDCSLRKTLDQCLPTQHANYSARRKSSSTCTI